jgi:2-isopropylmalate synthase
MSVEQKKKMFGLLVQVGFKEIEVGFPAASQPDFDFVRSLILEDRVPEDVTIQVLTQARPELIQRTFDSLKGARKAIMHVYNSTSVVQRQKVFKTDKAGIVEIAVNGAKEVLRCATRQTDTEWIFQYSPESFTGTEIDFAVEVCDAVTAVWQPTLENPVIINLPSTVEMATPNIYADQIEWFCRNIKNRNSIIVSLHTHNDRSCAVAAAELGVMAGAQRVEGTLLGNGERTGNMDIVVMAMNLYSQGIDPGLDLHDMDQIVSVVRECTQIDVHPRQAYSGDLVFTAFSGSHQDAIKKCLDTYEEETPWEIAYLPIDPRDIGRTYQDVIRVNSQSGKGGVAYVLANKFGFRLPRWLQIEFSRIVQKKNGSYGR